MEDHPRLQSRPGDDYDDYYDDFGEDFHDYDEVEGHPDDNDFDDCDDDPDLKAFTVLLAAPLAPVHLAVLLRSLLHHPRRLHLTLHLLRQDPVEPLDPFISLARNKQN